MAAPREWRLVCVRGQDAGRAFVLAPGAVDVGRGELRGIPLTDPTVSRRHFHLEVGGEKVVLKDLGSANQTLVNGHPVTTHVLAPGDRITVGASDLILVTPIEDLPAEGGSTIRLDPETKTRLIVGRSAATENLRKLTSQVAPRDAPVLLTGESGTGKEITARAIHLESARRSGPFVAVNCAALPRDLVESELFGHEQGAFTGAHRAKLGHFESARAGTLFLDEIGELPFDCQAKLLRALDEGQFFRVGGTQPVRSDARIVAATKRDLEAEVRAGSFREDLYYRLAVFPIRLLPLRERPEDIEALTHHFLRDIQRRDAPALRLGKGVLATLAAHAWPGNARELRNAIERAAILADGGEIRVEHLPPGIAPAAGPAPASTPDGKPGASGRSLDDVEKQQIVRVLLDTGWNKSRAAEILGIERNTLYRKMARYGIAPEGPSAGR